MIVGFSGKMGTGKTEVAHRICDRLGGEPGCIVAAFGSMLKQDVAQRFGIAYDRLLTREGKAAVYFHPDLPSQSMTGRQILQWWGTDKVRMEDPDRWARMLGDELDDWAVAHPRGHVLVDDVRFPNEGDMIMRRGGYVIRLDPWPGWIEGEDAGHESETAMDDYRWFRYRPDRKKNDLDALAAMVAEDIRAWGAVEDLDERFGDGAII
jgi:hypothetical protein